MGFCLKIKSQKRHGSLSSYVLAWLCDPGLLPVGGWGGGTLCQSVVTGIFAWTVRPSQSSLFCFEACESTCDSTLSLLECQPVTFHPLCPPLLMVQMQQRAARRAWVLQDDKLYLLDAELNES